MKEAGPGPAWVLGSSSDPTSLMWLDVGSPPDCSERCFMPRVAHSIPECMWTYCVPGAVDTRELVVGSRSHCLFTLGSGTSPGDACRGDGHPCHLPASRSSVPSGH